MNRWMLGVVVATCVGVGVYFATVKKETATPAGQPAAPVVAALPGAPPAPVVLTEVVDVADLDPLLDPPAKPVTGTPFDAEPPTVPVNTTTPPFIPLATDDDAIEVAPMPREVIAAPPVDPIHAVWYGEHRLPRQIGGGMSGPELLRHLADFNRRHPYYQLPDEFYREATGVGYGYFF